MLRTATFRGDVESGEGLRRRIRRTLALRRFLCIDDLLRQFEEPRDLVQAELESLLFRGEIERIRPAGYGRSDLDVYAIPRTDADVLDV